MSPPSGLPPLEFFDPVSLLPSTSQSLTTLTPEDGHLAFSVPRQSASDFLSTVQHIPATMPHSQLDNSEDQPTWVMKASQTPAERGLGQWLSDRRAEFLDLLKQSNALDITTMALIYISMNLTFVSLFLSMRNLGSSIWLATSVLLSSTFSFILALDVSLSLGIPITLRLLSESMPFLVVVIGFEKSIILTKAVLSHANDQQLQHGSGSSQNVILSAIRNAIKEKGSAIARHYFVEILILIGGAHSGVHGGLQEVCFLAAWILLFDCVLLFTFYTAILCIKLEVTRIRQSIHKQDNDSPSESTFGDSLKLRNIPYFKFWMVVGFVAVNVVDLFFLPARIETFDSSASSWSGGLDSVVKSPPIEPFKVAASGLAHMLSNAIACNQTTIVTVMAPVKYELTTPSASPAAMHNMRRSDTADMVDSLLASFEDPVLSKWIIAALALSIALNGYLFKAARQSFGDGASAPATPRLAPTTGETTTAAPSPQDRLHATTYILDMEDEAIVEACLVGTIPGYALERNLQDCTRAVKVRRSVVSRTAATRDVTCSLESSKLPYEHYAWERVLGTCCENVIGYTPLPLGVAGPLVIDGRSYYIPMATTEGVLVASASRGSKAMNLGGGVKTILTGDGMTRGPCVSFDTVERAGAAKTWLDSPVGQNTIRDAFNSTSRFARLQSIKTTVAGIYVYIRFKATTGDAMGMNMISKGVEHALNVMSSEAGFADLDIITLSGNYCADKKPTALNWIEGRGKGIVAEAIIPHDAVRTVLKSDVDSMVELNHAKNLVGSAMAGSVGGFNAQAANLAAAVLCVLPLSIQRMQSHANAPQHRNRPRPSPSRRSSKLPHSNAQTVRPPSP